MNSKTDSLSAITEYTEEELRNVDKVRTVIQCFSKFIHGRKLYAKNNPTLLKFASEFDQSFRDYFENEEELVLSIDRYSMMWRDQVVYNNDKREESIALLLHKDGVGELCFESAVTNDELERFVDLITEKVYNAATGDDVVTELWRADFDHIFYRVLDEYLVGEYGNGDQEAGAEQVSLEIEDHQEIPSFADRGRIIVDSSESVEAVHIYLNNLITQNFPTSSEAQKEERLQNLMDSLFKVNQEELTDYREELFQEKQEDRLLDLFEVILGFALMKDNPQITRDVTNVLDRIAEFVILEKNPTSLTSLLTTIRVFARSNQFTPNVASFFETLESKFCDTDLLLSLGELINTGTKSVDVFKYFKEVGSSSASAICQLLDRTSSAKFHREACDTLLAIAWEDIPSIISDLNMEKSQLARDAVYLTRISAPTEIPQMVKELMYYPDHKVQEEVIEYLADNRTEEAVALLDRLLDDNDQRIRIKATTAVANMKCQSLATKIVDMAFDKELSTRSMEEQEQVFRAAGRLGGETLVPRLRRMVEKKGLLGIGKGPSKENKLLAIRALEEIQAPDSIQILEQLANDSEGLVKAKAKRALDRMGRAVDLVG